MRTSRGRSRAGGDNRLGVRDPLQTDRRGGNPDGVIAPTLDAMLRDLPAANEPDQFLRDRVRSAHGPTRRQADPVGFDVPLKAPARGG